MRNPGKSTQSLGGKRFLTGPELAEWSVAEARSLWLPICELAETDSTVNLIIDLPHCSAGDVQIALMPREIIIKQYVRVLASRSWRDMFRAVFGPRALFRRFEMPASIDVNRVRADLELGVLTVIAPKQTAVEQPAGGVPETPRAFAA